MKRKGLGFPTLFTGILLVGYFLGSIVMYNNLMDPPFLPRFMVLSCTFLLLWVIILFKGQQQDIIKTSDQFYLVFAFGLYVIYVISWSWSSVISEAIMESQRTFLFVSTLLFSSYALRIRADFEVSFIKLTLCIGVIAIAMAIPQVFSNHVSAFEIKNTYLVNSISGHKNLFSSLLFLLGVFALVGLKKLQNPWRYLAIINLIAYTIFIIFLQTRAVWMGLLLGGIFLALYAAKNLFQLSKLKLLLLLGSIVLFTVIILWSADHFTIGKHYLDRMQFWKYASSSSGNERLVLWQKTICLLQGKWILGCGAGQWQFHVTECTYSGLEWSLFKNYTFQRPHNDFIWVLAEVGIVGFVFFVGMWGIVLFRSLLTAFQQMSESSSIAIYTFGIIGFLTISFFDFPKERIEHNLLAAHLLVFACHRLDFSWQLKNWRIPKWTIYVFLVLTVFSGLVGWYRWKGEYHALRMNNFYRNSNFQGTLREADKAYSFFYKVDIYSMPIHWYKGGALFQLQSPDHGLPNFIEAYQISPFNALVINNLSTSYAASGDLENAVKNYEECFRLAPSYDAPKFNYVQILMMQKKYKQALDIIKSVEDKNVQKKAYLNAIESALKNN